MAKTDTTQDESQPTELQPMHDAAAILASLDIEALLKGQLEQIVNQKVEERLAQQAQVVNPANQVVYAETRNQPAPPTLKYLKHYRNDKSPNMKIKGRTIVDGKPYKPTRWNYASKMWEDPDPLGGEYIQFRRGHFFATEQWQVDLLDWMSMNPATDPSSDQTFPRVIGGEPTIYEDDGKLIGTCPYCSEPFIPGSNALKAHLRATHGIVG